MSTHVEHKKKMIHEANHIPLSVHHKVNKNTFSNYVAHIALHGDISINKKQFQKQALASQLKIRQEDQLVMFFLLLPLTLWKLLNMTKRL